MPPVPITTREQTLFVDQDHPSADFTFDGTTGWYQSPAPYRLLLALGGDIQPADVRRGVRLAVRLGWQVVQGKRWRYVQALRVIAPDVGREHGAADVSATEVEPTSFSTLLARAPRTDRPGGARGVVGRKTLAAGEATEAHSITLPASAWRLLERIGGGNRSEGVRRLVEDKGKTEAQS